MSERIALVTGASRGIGAEIARELSRARFFVLLNYRSQEDRAKEVLNRITSEGGKGALCPFDVADPKAVEKAIGAIPDQYKAPLEVLVNNAGITVDSLLVRLKDEDLEKTLAVDLKGAIYCTREAAKQMMRARKGSIIQISSVIGESGNAGQSAYAAAKAGLAGFSKSVAKELASRHVRVNVVAPGFISTEMTENLTDAQKEAYLRTIPVGYLGEPKDIASLVGFLASEQSRYMTGQVISVNGGLYI